MQAAMNRAFHQRRLEEFKVAFQQEVVLSGTTATCRVTSTGLGNGKQLAVRATLKTSCAACEVSRNSNCRP